MLLTEDSLVFVKDFTFYSVFNGYLTFVTICNTKSVFMVAALIMSVIFFILEIKGAVYMK